ncbi:MAG: hypothetical protein AB8B54_14995 [Sphingorhabdus sp.]
MTPKRIQFFIALVFFILGGWATFFPQHVIDTVFLPEYREGGRLLPFAIACFGAQALLSGLFAAFSRFSQLHSLSTDSPCYPFLGSTIITHFMIRCSPTWDCLTRSAI